MIEVVAEVYPPSRPGANSVLREAGTSDDAAVMQRLVASGLRAQLRTGNLLTGQRRARLHPGGARGCSGPRATGAAVLPARQRRERRHGANADGRR